ncbi:MAG: hypothetical protein IJ391_07850 [Clostridia bacterium]|nr:hypothetical protein [Clostridia bacterium]
MKRTAVSILIVLCIALGVFLVYSLNISGQFSDAVHMGTPVSARYVSGAAVAADGMHSSEGIAEDPSIGVLILPYDYSAPVPESEPVDNAYFDRCVFIGDSRMLGLVKYNDIDPINYCSVGFSVASYDTAEFIRVGEETFNVRDALRENDDYDAVYISTGINELGWSRGRFAEKYRDMINDIKSTAGERPIYIQLIMPVTNGFEASKIMNPYGLKNSDVSLFNETLVDIAQECGVYYFDCSELFVLDDGSLDPKVSSDGAHLTLKAYGDQLEFYKTHVVNEEEYR